MTGRCGRSPPIRPGMRARCRGRSRALHPVEPTPGCFAVLAGRCPSQGRPRRGHYRVERRVLLTRRSRDQDCRFCNEAWRDSEWRFCLLPCIFSLPVLPRSMRHGFPGGCAREEGPWILASPRREASPFHWPEPQAPAFSLRQRVGSSRRRVGPESRQSTAATLARSATKRAISTSRWAGSPRSNAEGCTVAST